MHIQGNLFTVLYGKFGFVREGLLKKDICVHCAYHNHIAMGLYID
jgi:hypothetical protein